MNIAIINKNTGMCENIAVFENIEIARSMLKDYIVTEQQDEYGAGDIFKDGKWERGKVHPEVSQPTIEEQLMELQLAVVEVYEKMT